MFIDIITNILYEFFNTFKVVNGRNQYYCTLVTFIYFLATTLFSIIGWFTFISNISAGIALLINLVLSFITATQLNDINKLKKYVNTNIMHKGGGLDE